MRLAAVALALACAGCHGDLLYEVEVEKHVRVLSTDTSSRRREDAVYQLIWLIEAAEPPMPDHDWRKRPWSRRYTGGSRRAVDALVVATRDSALTVRDPAGSALMHLAPDHIGPAMARLAIDDSDLSVEAVWVMARLHDVDSAAHAVEVWRIVGRNPPDLDPWRPDSRWRFASELLRRLFARGKERSVPYMRPLLTDDSWWVQFQALKVLCQLGAATPEEVAPFLTSEHELLRLRSFGCFTEPEGPNSIYRLAEDGPPPHRGPP